MSKSILEEIEQITGGIFGSDFRENYATVMRRNYYALEASSIKESFDSDVFSLYDDQKYKSVERPKSHFTFSDLSTDAGNSVDNDDYGDENGSSLEAIDEPNFCSLLSSTKGRSTDPDDSLESEIYYGYQQTSDPPISIIDRGTRRCSRAEEKSIEYNRRLSRYFEHQNSIEELKQVRDKVRDVRNLDFDVNSLIFKAVEVHTDILVS